MFVQKRDGRREAVSFDKITARVTKLSYGLNTDFCVPVGSERACQKYVVMQDWGVGLDK